jgi:hypothetical protein
VEGIIPSGFNQYNTSFGMRLRLACLPRGLALGLHFRSTFWQSKNEQMSKGPS